MLSPRRILLTGASSGIGRELARLLARPGRELALVARSEAGLQEVREEVYGLGGAARVFPADLSEADGVEKLLDLLHDAGFAPQALALNAGASRNAFLRHASPGELERELRLNYLAPLHLIQRLALQGPVDARASVIAATASLTTVTAFPGNAGYAASKAALVIALRSLAIEEPRLRIHALLPGLVDTGLSQKLTEGALFAKLLPRSSAREVASHLRRLLDFGGAPVEVAGAGNAVIAGLSGAMPGLTDALSGLVAEWLTPGFAGARRRAEELDRVAAKGAM